MMACVVAACAVTMAACEKGGDSDVTSNPGDGNGDQTETPGDGNGDDTPTVLADPKVGDIYYSDGSWSTELQEDKTPIGVVFFVGTGSGDSASFYTTKGGASMEAIKGYVIALHDATETVNDNAGVVWSFYDGWYDGAGCSKELDDFLGYTNTLSIRQAATRSDCPAGEFNGTDQSFPAAWYASDGYDALYPAPASSSGWYLPSLYQLKYIWDKVYFQDANMLASVENTLKMLAGGDMTDTTIYPDDATINAMLEASSGFNKTVTHYYVPWGSTATLLYFAADSNMLYGPLMRQLLALSRDNTADISLYKEAASQTPSAVQSLNAARTKNSAIERKMQGKCRNMLRNIKF